MIKEFREFALKGSLVDLAVAFILGVAFAAVVTSLVDNIFMPIIGAVVSDESFANLSADVGGAELRYGAFLAALLNFVLIALVLFIVVKAVNQLRRREEVIEEATTKSCPACAMDIPVQATRCPYCVIDLPVAVS
jgi:large conductance mechanosensitive channel